MLVGVGYDTRMNQLLEWSPRSSFSDRLQASRYLLGHSGIDDRLCCCVLLIHRTACRQASRPCISSPPRCARDSRATATLPLHDVTLLSNGSRPVLLALSVCGFRGQYADRQAAAGAPHVRGAFPKSSWRCRRAPGCSINCSLGRMVCRCSPSSNLYVAQHFAESTLGQIQDLLEFRLRP